MAGPPDAALLLDGGHHGRPLWRAGAFRRVCAAASLVTTSLGADGTPKTSPRFTPHGLRHTYAALHLQHGTDVYYVSRQLGHASIELTVSTYGAWLQPNRRAAVDALDRIAGPATDAETRG